MKKIYLILMACILINLALVSAFEFDNVKEPLQKGEGISKYGKIEIKNLFGLGSTLATLELKTNTDICMTDCSAVKEIVLFNRGALIDDVKFETLQDGKRIEQPIRSYQFYIQTGTNVIVVDKYEVWCGGKQLTTIYQEGCSEVSMKE